MASALDTAEEVIEQRIAAAFPTTATHWSNVAFTPPASAVWLQPRILWGRGVHASMQTTQRNTVIGVLHVNCFSQQNVGPGAARRLADQVRDQFNRVEVSGVRFGVPSGPRAERLDSVFHVVSVTIPFTVDETL